MTRTTVVSETNLVQSKLYPPPTLESRLQAALEHARRLTALFEVTDPQVAIAWETVEELLAEKARRREAKKTSFTLYCEENPSAPECRIYDD